MSYLFPSPFPSGSHYPQGKTEGRRRRGWQRRRWLDGIIDNRDEFEQILGDSEWQGNLACCSPWGRKELDMSDRTPPAPPRRCTVVAAICWLHPYKCSTWSCRQTPLKVLGRGQRRWKQRKMQGTVSTHARGNVEQRDSWRGKKRCLWAGDVLFLNECRRQRGEER